MTREYWKFVYSYAHVVRITAKRVISRSGKYENGSEMYKMIIARAKRAKLLFFIVKCVNLLLELPNDDGDSDEDFANLQI